MDDPEGSVTQGRQEASHGEAESVHIAPGRNWAALRLDELWEYRELFYFLTWRDIKVRYKQTVLGAAWAVLQPFCAMVVFSVFLGRLARVPSDGVPYPVFAYAALLPWNYFAGALAQSTDSVVGSAQLVRKVYFPRLVMPAAGALSGLLDFAIAFTVLLLMMVYYGLRPTPAVLLLPAFVLMALVTALGAGIWLSALNVEYRDVRYVVPFLTQFWMFATPVVYPSSLLAEPWRTIYGLNPMVGVVEGFRWAMLGTAVPSRMLAVSALVSVLVFVSGAYYFRRVERTFADVV
jgi:lipopolysaccharide transport system permease protein